MTDAQPKTNSGGNGKMRVSELDSVMNFRRSWFGQWFSRIIGRGNDASYRNYYEAFGYKGHLTPDDYLAQYLRNGVAKRIIEAPVKATWSDPPVLTADANFMKVWDDLVSQQYLWHRIMQLDRLAGLGQYAILVIGIDDGLPLDQPVGSGSRVNNCIYLQPYMQRTAQIETWDTDPRSKRFGKPLMYRVTPQLLDLQGNFVGNKPGGVPISGKGSGSPSQTLPQPFRVHYSRVLHIADGSLENDVYGIPTLQPVFNWLDDLLKVVGGSAETYWMTANRGITANVDKDMELDPEDASALSAELDEFQNNLRRIIRTRGVDVKNLGSDLADPLNNVEVLLSMISASTGIPKRVLMGAEAGNLASTQDRANWSDRVGEREKDYAEPGVLLPLIRTLIGLRVLPTTAQLSIRWPEVYKLSPLERGQTSAQMARSAANLQKQLSAPIGATEMIEVSTEQEMEDVPAQDAIPGDPANPADQGTPAQPATKRPTGNQVVTTKKWIQGGTPMFTLEEAREIVGFGKTMPVFNDTGDSKTTNPGSQGSDT